jgi:hypothetical protein
MTRETRIYIISALEAGIVKVGYSINVGKRLKALQNSSPIKLEVSWVSPRLRKQEAIEVERSIHQRLTKSRMHGEWFAVGQADCITIAEGRMWSVCGLSKGDDLASIETKRDWWTPRRRREGSA